MMIVMMMHHKEGGSYLYYSSRYSIIWKTQFEAFVEVLLLIEPKHEIGERGHFLGKHYRKEKESIEA
jgi:hypothetical protein